MKHRFVFSLLLVLGLLLLAGGAALRGLAFRRLLCRLRGLLRRGRCRFIVF